MSDRDGSPKQVKFACGRSPRKGLGPNAIHFDVNEFQVSKELY